MIKLSDILKTFLVALALLGSVSLLGAQQKPFSGPQVGETIEPFTVLAANGPDAGKEVDFISRYGDAPTMLIFLHQLDRNVAALLRPCERFAQERESAGLKSLIVFLADDKIAGERKMQNVVRSLEIKMPVGVSLEGIEGPGAYGLNKGVAVTTLVAKDRKVTANHTFVQAGIVDAPKILTDVAAHVGGKVPTADEMMAQLPGRRRMQGKPSGGRMSEDSSMKEKNKN